MRVVERFTFMSDTYPFNGEVFVVEGSEQALRLKRELEKTGQKFWVFREVFYGGEVNIKDKKERKE